MKHALIFGGGGSRGTYEAGIWKALAQDGQEYNICAGTSIGAIIGAFYTQKDLDGLLEFVKQLSAKRVSPNLFAYPDKYVSQADSFSSFVSAFQKGGPSIEPLKETLHKLLDVKQIQASPIQFGCTAVNLNTNELEFFTKEQFTQDNFVDLLTASAAYFPAFSFVEYKGTYYADGGYKDTVPWDLAQKMGADTYTVIDLHEPGHPRTCPASPEFFYIQPLLKLHYFLDFDREDNLKQVAQGYLEGLKYLNKAPGYLFTFNAQDWPAIRYVQTLAEETVPLQPEEIDGLLEMVLGYSPYPLDNIYMQNYQIGKAIEVLAFLAGMDPYRQYAFPDFLAQLLADLESLSAKATPETTPADFAAMTKMGTLDILVFFKSALDCFEVLPVQFNIFIQRFHPFYGLAKLWKVLETI